MIETITQREWRQGGPDGRDKNDKEPFGYTPQIPQKKLETVTAFELVVDDMNLHKVADAILAATKPTNV